MVSKNFYQERQAIIKEMLADYDEDERKKKFLFYVNPEIEKLSFQAKIKFLGDQDDQDNQKLKNKNQNK